LTVNPRPLSPHLQVYRFFPAMAVSILHRASGVFLSLASLLLVYWLLAVANGPDAYAAASQILASLPGRLVIAAAVIAFWYHLLAGLRHLLLDAGIGFDLPVARRIGFAVVALAVLAAAATLAAAWRYLDWS